MNIKKFTKKDRHGNMMSFEFDTPEASANIPPMNMIPQYNAVGGMTANHPGKPKGSDTVPAWLTPGEFVVNKEAVDIYGPQIKKMNDVGRDVQDGDMSPTQAPPMYASTGKAAKEYPAEKKLENQIAIYEHLKSRGLSDKAAAGLMAQIQHESAGTFDYQWQEHSGKGGHGLFQMDPNSGGWLGPYEQWLRKKHMDDMNKMELEPVVPGGPALNPTMQFDSLQNQLDFAIDLYTNPNAVPHPTDPGQYYIGPGNAASVRTVLGNPDVDLVDMSNTLVDTWINPGEKKENPGRREDRQQDTKDMWELIQKGTFASPQDPSGIATWIEDAQQLWQDMSKPKVEIPEANPSSFNPFSWLFPNHRGKENAVPKLDSSNEYDFKNKGGPIYASQGKGLGTYEEEMLKNLQHDYNNPWNPWDNVYSVGMDYGHTPMPASYAPPVPTPTPDAYADPNKITPPGPESVENSSIMDLIFPSGVQNTEAIADDLGAENDSTTRTDMGGGSTLFAAHPPPLPEVDAFNDIQPGPFTGELGADEEGRAPLVGTQAVPPILGVGDGREDYRPSGFVPTMADADPNTVGESLELGNIAELEAAYEDAMNIAILSNEDDPDFEAKQEYVKIAKEKLDAAKSGHKILDAYKDVAPQFGGEPQWIKDVAARKILADEQATIDELKSRLNDPNITKEYKKLLEEKIAEKQKALEAEAAKVQTDTKENKLAKLGSKINDATEAEIKSKLDSEQGKAALENAGNKGDNDPEVSKTKQMFDFLFGDLIDKGEIGRAITVYLASRALGYNHDGSIGFVAKQYIKRVDAKNAQMDKWILDNSHLYDKGSLAEFKRTKDPSKLIRIGASPRSTGEKEMQYHKKLGQMMAYEFKVKNAQGDDITYWSFDINGLKPELRVGSGWSDKNVIDVSIAEINAVKDVITGVHLAKDKHTTGSKDNKKTIYRSGRGSTPGILAESVAGETAQWLFDRGIPPGKFLQPIDGAYTALIAANQKLLEDDEDAVLHSSLIPFLEDATIKLRLENMMYKGKDGKMRSLPSPVKATVDGKERTMTKEKLIEIQQRIESVYTTAESNLFWAELAKTWKEEAHEDFQDDPKKKKTWREVFMKMAKEKDNAAYTPFGLFAHNIIENEIAGIGTSLQP